MEMLLPLHSQRNLFIPPNPFIPGFFLLFPSGLPKSSSCLSPSLYLTYFENRFCSFLTLRPFRINASEINFRSVCHDSVVALRPFGGLVGSFLFTPLHPSSVMYYCFSFCLFFVSVVVCVLSFAWYSFCRCMSLRLSPPNPPSLTPQIPQTNTHVLAHPRPPFL